MLLALETATNVCSVAFENEEGSVYEKRTEQRGAHSEQLFLFIETLMEEHNFNISDLEALLISEGPGSYTGLRIGASAVKGLLFQTKVPLYCANTLSSFAMAAARACERARGGTIHSIIDARRKHFYYQPYSYAEGHLSSLGEVQVITIEDFEKEVEMNDVIIGTGFDRMDEAVSQKVQTRGSASITAKSLIFIHREQGTLLQKADPESFSPEYYTSNQVSG